MPLVFELELFKPEIGISFFGLETRMARLIAPKICTKKNSYMPQLRSKFQVSTFSRFKDIAFFIFVHEFVKYAGKNIRTSDAKRRGSPNNNNNNNDDIKQSSGIYIASEQRKARAKTILIKFLLSRNICSLRNVTRSNEQYVPITGYRRHLYKNKY